MNATDPERKLECELIPQGTFAEAIRAGGAGLGGVLTPNGGRCTECDRLRPDYLRAFIADAIM